MPDYEAFPPYLDAALAMEFRRFGIPAATEGLAAHREKRPLRFS